ncbi:hypothetical protein [Rhizobium leguminosarum]|uniref:hypothetical protein n=1 Tax=Rhizobium leguminosarum TaxID=384 RepID=UPI001C939780|nr:hypothetical protein [Rhizobium leguminosarum]MBY5329549.1 hypothetical protein [Rhizobium leguminosarum]
MYLFAQFSELMHDIVRSFVLKHGVDPELYYTPEVAWNWIFDSLRDVGGLDVDQRYELASYCFQSIRARMGAVHGGQDGVH